MPSPDPTLPRRPSPRSLPRSLPRLAAMALSAPVLMGSLLALAGPAQAWDGCGWGYHAGFYGRCVPNHPPPPPWAFGPGRFHHPPPPAFYGRAHGYGYGYGEVRRGDYPPPPPPPPPFGDD